MDIRVICVLISVCSNSSSFFLKDPATTESYTYCHTLSLHDALPILARIVAQRLGRDVAQEARRGQRGELRAHVVEVAAGPAHQRRFELGAYLGDGGEDEIGRAHV